MAILFYTITLTCTFSLVFSIWIYILMTLYGADAITVRAVDAIATHMYFHTFIHIRFLPYYCCCCFNVIVSTETMSVIVICLPIPFVFTYCWFSYSFYFNFMNTLFWNVYCYLFTLQHIQTYVCTNVAVALLIPSVFETNFVLKKND